ncbi:hypothetical protein KZC51_08545 [Microbacterium sp. SSW1-49]|uniref:DUF4878 domain-containing protein n=1 Tax=Microbacterium croceum TaxID=2851645 RepID=A0ABT0FE58_9MICO|nr:hypothetical protein [Microbacterium croceum]MCK2036184.1 hypothetical protein [Microbacterium croceum]
MTRRRVWILASAAGLVLLIGAGLWIWQVSSRPASAEDTALSYLRALESGDAAALASVSTKASETSLTAFAAADERIEDPATTAVDQSGDTATAEVSFVLAGETRTASLPLSRTEGRWRVDAAGRGSVQADASTGAFFMIGDATFAIGEDAALFPAVYTVAPAPRELLSGEAEVIVLPGETAEVSLDAALLPEATEAAQSALEERLAECTTGGAEIPAGCGIRIPWGTEFRAVSDIRYRIEAPPSLTLTTTHFDATDGVLVATVTGTGQDGSPRTTTYRTESWLVRGDVSFTATNIVLAPW